MQPHAASSPRDDQPAYTPPIITQLGRLHNVVLGSSAGTSFEDSTTRYDAGDIIDPLATPTIPGP